MDKSPNERALCCACPPSTGSPPSRKTRAAVPDGNKSCRLMEGTIAYLRPSRPHHRHRPATKGAMDPLGALPHPVSGILPFGSTAPLPPTYLKKFMCSKSLACKNVRPGLRRARDHARKTSDRSTERGRGAWGDKRAEPIDFHAQNYR